MGISAAVGIGLFAGSMAGKGKLPDPLNLFDPNNPALGFPLPDPLNLHTPAQQPHAPTLVTPPAPGPASPQDPRASAAGLQQRKRAQGGQGRSDTVKTGPGGLGEVGPQNQERKTLLGY